MDEVSYTTHDKSQWGPGPWQSEPDKVSWTDPASGLPCLIVRGPTGALCGYVGVGEGHLCFQRDYSDRECESLTAHGGLTYASGCAHGPEESSVCHIPAPGASDNVWWLGFDCAHGWDLRPGRISRFAFDPTEIYRDIDYVKRNVEQLASQLAAMIPRIEFPSQI